MEHCGYVALRLAADPKLASAENFVQGITLNFTVGVSMIFVPLMTRGLCKRRPCRNGLCIRGSSCTRFYLFVSETYAMQSPALAGSLTSGVERRGS